MKLPSTATRPAEDHRAVQIRPLGWAGLRRTDHERMGIHGPDPRRIQEDHGQADRLRRATLRWLSCAKSWSRPDPGWLKDLSRKLVEQQLCASAHNFAPVRSRCPASPREPLPMATRITWCGFLRRRHRI